MHLRCPGQDRQYAVHQLDVYWRLNRKTPIHYTDWVYWDLDVQTEHRNAVYLCLGNQIFLTLRVNPCNELYSSSASFPPLTSSDVDIAIKDTQIPSTVTNINACQKKYVYFVVHLQIWHFTLQKCSDTHTYHFIYHYLLNP